MILNPLRLAIRLIGRQTATPRRRLRLSMEQLEARDVPAISIQFDYSYDSGGFFSGSNIARRAILPQAANDIGNQITTSLAAISPSGGNTWSADFLNPATGLQVSVGNPSIAANTTVVYVGSRTLTGNETARGGFGGYSANGTQPWLTSLASRGPSQPFYSNGNAMLWGGSIAFSPSTNWWFGSSITGIGSTQVDFYSTVCHELGHMFGIGTSYSWFNKISGTNFTGTGAQAVYAGSVPVSGDSYHFADGVTINSHPVMMDPVQPLGTRVPATLLDLTALRDIGWSTAWNQMNVGDASVIATDSSGTVYGSFSGYGVWKYTGSLVWQRINTADASMLVVDGGGNLYGKFNGQGIWKFTGTTSWTQINIGDPAAMAAGGSGILYATFAGQGVYQYSGSTNWGSPINYGDASILVVDGGGTLYGKFNGQGIWLYSGLTSWTQINYGDPTVMAAGGSGKLYGSFIGYGVWQYTGSTSWTLINSAEATVLTAEGNNLYGSFSGQGVWQFVGSTSWVHLGIWDAPQLVVGAGNLIGTLTGYGVWKYHP